MSRPRDDCLMQSYLQDMTWLPELDLAWMQVSSLHAGSVVSGGAGTTLFPCKSHCTHYIENLQWSVFRVRN